MPFDNGARLPHFIRTQAVSILDAWEVAVSRLAPCAANTGALRMHAQEVLAAIAADLEELSALLPEAEQAQAPPDFLRAQDAAQRHAAHRHAAGYPINQLVAEYRALRATVQKLWTASPLTGRSIDASELSQFNEALDAALAQAVARFANEAEDGRRKLDALLQAVPVGIGLADRDGKITHINAANQRIWGDAPISNSVDDYAAFKGWWADGSARHGKPIQPHEWGLARALRGEEARDVVEIQPFNSAVRKTVLLYAMPVRDRGAEITGAVVAQMDITGQVRAEAALLESEANSERRQRLYETLLENSPDLAYVFDLNHRFTYANKVLLQMWSKSWDESIGKNCLELGYEPWHAEMHSREIEEVKASKRPVKGEVPFDGSFGRRIYEYIFVPVIGPDGEVEAVAGTTRDVTERKQDEDALRESNRLKDEFLALLAHELRNPLAPISAAAEALPLLISDEALIRRTAEIIRRQVKHLTGLVDDLLDVSRVTRGLVNLQQGTHDMKSVVHDAVEQVRPLIESLHHRLTLELGAQAACVKGDQKRLVQILTNLLNNAAKYTPQGGNISLSIKVDEAQVCLSVADDGIGIAPTLQPHIFDLFAQAERTADRSQGGLGIGLALVKSLTELHGGSVACFSEGAGKGSRFTVSFPRLREAVPPAFEADALPSATPAGSARRILVVDDNEDAARLLALNLQLLGNEVMVELDARAALERALVFKPHICILDIGLPEMDGNELARRLRALEHTRSARLIAITGYGQEKDKALSNAAGFDQHLVKPVEMAELVALLA